MRASMALIVTSLICVANAESALAQTYPNKPILIVTGEAGGSTNYAARFLARGIESGVKQNVVVENKPSILVGDVVSKAQPDGYTLLVAGGTFVMGSLVQGTSYDPVKDFVPISLLTNSPSVLVVHPSVPAKTVKDLIDLAKSKPGKLNYASGNSGSTNHLAAELFKAMAGVNIMRIPYKGQGQATIDLVGGQVQLMFGGASIVAPHIKAGKLNPLAVTSAKPSALFPELPTIAASGVPGYPARTMCSIPRMPHSVSDASYDGSTITINSTRLATVIPPTLWQVC